jgi:chaperone required for assembly of F1-ATPase
MKKFYHLVAINRYPDGYAILLDAKPVKTRQGQLLLAPTEALAQAVMSEWVNQADTIEPDTMPLTQLLTTFLDGVQGNREKLHADVMAYLDTDLLCYRAADPPAFAARQARNWDPILEWFQASFAATVQTTTALSAIKQDERVHQSVETYIRNLSDYEFSILQTVTAETGSLILALAFLEKAVTPDEAFNAAQTEELLKSEIYLEDEYGKAPDIEKKQSSLLLILQAARTFLDALLPSLRG